MCLSHLAGRGAGAEDSDSAMDHTGGFLLNVPELDSLRGKGKATVGAPLLSSDIL